MFHHCVGEPRVNAAIVIIIKQKFNCFKNIHAGFASFYIYIVINLDFLHFILF